MPRDYSFRKKVLEEHKDLIIRQRKASKLEFAICQFMDKGIKSPVLEMQSIYNERTYQLIDFVVSNGLVEEYQEAVRINQSNYKRAKRLENRISSMLAKGRCKFLTITFRDFSTTTPKQRRILIVRWLKSLGGDYVANIDFGDNHEYIDNHGNKRKATQREHYHAIVQVDRLNKETWSHGFVDVESIKTPNQKALAKYVAKLTNHAIKETTKRSALIYSR